ncbi:MAG: MarR family transcriptional regulator [Planctomycetes bacterium]|nr:MarR family transcriptional regulator [Planctomycetota bacterium]
MTPSTANNLADEVFNSLVRLFWGARQFNQALTRGYGVTAAQLSALRILERRGEQTQSQLAGLMLVSGSTLSGIVDRLQARELVRRERSETDRRTVKVVLAPAGHELLGSLPKGASKFGAMRQLVKELPEHEARRFLEILNAMIDLLTDAAEGEPEGDE